MKPGRNFKLPKSIKRVAATFVDPHRRGDYLRAMTGAVMAAQEQPRRSRTKTEAQ